MLLAAADHESLVFCPKCLLSTWTLPACECTCQGRRQLDMTIAGGQSSVHQSCIFAHDLAQVVLFLYSLDIRIVICRLRLQ